MGERAGIASLPMYDWPCLHAPTDQWWRAISARLCDLGLKAPQKLNRNIGPRQAWSSDRLLLSQTCGYPLMHAFCGRLRVVAAPVHTAPGCDGPYYSSFIITRRECPVTSPKQLAGRTACYNMTDSLSGHLALRLVFGPYANDGRFFDTVIETGSHFESMNAVASGKADVAAIDCVVHAMAARHFPDLACSLKIIARSPSAPALPYVTAASAPDRQVDKLRKALAGAAADPALARVRKALFISRFHNCDGKFYQPVLELEARTAKMNYLEIA